MQRTPTPERHADFNTDIENDGHWITESSEKADAFARTFASKAHLPEEVVDTPYFGCADVAFDDLVIFRSRATKRLFDKLDVKKATGGDMISAAILKKLADCLSVPFTVVVRRLFHEGCWPRCWKQHLICPIFKRGAAFKPENYRGVHLTTILSKVAEKMVGSHLVPYLQKKTKSMGVHATTELERLGDDADAPLHPRSGHG